MTRPRPPHGAGRGVVASASAAVLVSCLAALVLVMGRPSTAATTPPPPADVIRPHARATASVRAAGPGTRAAIPASAAVRRARRFARARAGRVSFAVYDDRGRLACHACRRAYPSASVSKAMLLIADLRRIRRAGHTPTEGDRAVLARMVRESDNAAADLVFARNGDPGLRVVARRAGMRDFRPAGYWAQARLTAADQARLFARLTSMVPREERAFARRLLRTVVGWQTWGIPAWTRPAWRTMFKGGWRPGPTGALVHQAARLERNGRIVALAVLTDGNPSHEYGVQTIRGISRRLLPR